MLLYTEASCENSHSWIAVNRKASITNFTNIYIYIWHQTSHHNMTLLSLHLMHIRLILIYSLWKHENKVICQNVVTVPLKNWAAKCPHFGWSSSCFHPFKDNLNSRVYEHTNTHTSDPVWWQHDRTLRFHLMNLSHTHRVCGKAVNHKPSTVMEEKPSCLTSCYTALSIRH